MRVEYMRQFEYDRGETTCGSGSTIADTFNLLRETIPKHYP
jgi:hypothetical protein